MWVKICGITRLEDAMDAARFGADAVGFVFAESPRRIAPDDARRICWGLNGKVQKVGVFVDRPLEEVRETVEHCGLDLVQLHGNESREYCEALGDIVIKALHVNGSFDVAKAAGYRCRALLFDSHSPERAREAGRTFDWNLLRLLEGNRRIIVAGGLGPDNVAAAVRASHPYGVDVSSGIESEPGIKDPVLMYRFIEKARKADYEVNGY
ncbi:MAG: phosphoribosylanthranilate isomerase [Actinomycetota bacterium]